MCTLHGCLLCYQHLCHIPGDKGWIHCGRQESSTWLLHPSLCDVEFNHHDRGLYRVACLLQCQQSFQAIGHDCARDNAEETRIYAQQRSLLQQDEVLHTAVPTLGGILSIQWHRTLCLGLHLHILCESEIVNRRIYFYILCCSFRLSAQPPPTWLCCCSSTWRPYCATRDSWPKLNLLYDMSRMMPFALHSFNFLLRFSQHT